MKIGDEVYIHGYIDEIRQDAVIIRNDGGYFGTIPDEVVYYEDNSYGKPCVRALNKVCREKRIKIDYSDKNFEKIWRGEL